MNGCDPGWKNPKSKIQIYSLFSVQYPGDLFKISKIVRNVNI